MALLSRTHPIRYEAKNVSYYSTITEAVSSAKNGDRIVVHPGVYCEQVILYKNVILIGADNQGIYSDYICMHVQYFHTVYSFTVNQCLLLSTTTQLPRLLCIMNHGSGS